MARMQVSYLLRMRESDFFSTCLLRQRNLVSHVFKHKISFSPIITFHTAILSKKKGLKNWKWSISKPKYFKDGSHIRQTGLCSVVEFNSKWGMGVRQFLEKSGPYTHPFNPNSGREYKGNLGANSHKTSHRPPNSTVTIQSWHWKW